MDINDMVLVSVDDHVVEPPHLFEGRLPAKYVDLAPQVRHPRRRHQRLGATRARRSPTSPSTPSPAGRPEEYGMEPTSFAELRAGCYDIDERVKDMDANGVLGSLCFPSFPQFCGQLFARTEDKDVALAMVRAYNDWHIDEWCGTHPGRFIPCPLPGHLGPRGAGRRGAPHRRARAPTPSPSRRTRRSSAGRASTPTTGTRSGRRAATRTSSCACTSARRRRWSSPRPTRRSTA